MPEFAPPIATLQDSVSLQQKCLNTKAGTCILALLPDGAEASETTLQAVSSLSEIHHKHEAAKRNLFPFIQLPHSNPEAAELRSKLELGSDVELIALNGKRSWYRHYTKTSFGQADVEDWIDSIRMGEGSKGKVPDGLIVEAADLPPEPVRLDSSKGPQAMKEALKSQMPEGVEFEFEEINDNDYDRIIAQAKAEAEKKKAEDDKVDEHDEL